MMMEWIASSCFVILAVVALRAVLGGRIRASLRYALWGLVLVRLLVPVQLFTSQVAGFEVSSIPDVMREENIYVLPVQSLPLGDVPNITVGKDGAIYDGNSFGFARVEGETICRYAARLSPLEVLRGIWLLGSVVLGTTLLVSNLSFATRLRRVRRPLKCAAEPIPVFTAEGLPSPCLFGLLHTTIYVTPKTAENPVMLRHVIAHEVTHYRHLDHLWSILRGVALAVHWWNPLVWLAVVLSRRDGELACDEGALKRLGDGERAAYGDTLLTLVTARPSPQDLFSFATTMSGGKRSLRERIFRIVCQPKSLVSATVAVVLLLCLTVVCAFVRKEEVIPPQAGELQVLGALDLDWDGKEEEIWCLKKSDEPPEWSFSVVKEERETVSELWSVTLDETRERCGTYFHYQNGGRDYLLEYMPQMQQGACTYAYRLFHLENGEEVTDLENAVAFDINFASTDHQFDPASIASFMEEVNRLIGESVLLMNTNQWMVNLAEGENGRLYDDILAVLNHPGEDLHSMPLRDALESYAQRAADHPDDTNSSLGNLLADLEAEDIASIGGDVQTAGLARLLREAAPNRLSRFHEYAWFVEEGAWAWSSAELTASIQGGGTLYMLACDSGSVKLAYETEEGCTSAYYESAELYALISQAGRAYFREELPYMADLNHDGTPDQLVLRGDRWDGTEYLLECIPGDGDLVWSGAAHTSHAGWNALFLCQLDGEDYLLQYNPYMSSGVCEYQYQLFYLNEGSEVVVQKNSVTFDIIFARNFSGNHQFDPRAIAAFMDEINGLLANSTQLLNTDGNLLNTFEKEKRLYDSLSWLDEDFARDEDKSLLENLIRFQNESVARAAIPTAEEIFSEIKEEDLRFVASPVSYVLTGELAAALNAITDWTYNRNVEGWEGQRWAVEVLYTRAGDAGEQSMTLEWGMSGGEEQVRVTMSGQATAVQYSENPGVEGTYLHDVPYSFCVYVADQTFCDLVKEISVIKQS